MVNFASSNLINKNSRLMLDIFISVVFVFTLCFFFDPHWETNDDIAMSMVVHGYGIASVGMPNLVFSNIVWGH